MKSKSADKIKMPSIDELLGVSGEESATDIADTGFSEARQE